MVWSLWLAAFRGSEDMGDLEFLQKKADAGNLIIVQGSRSTVGVIVSYTPPNGKVFVIYKAEISTKITNVSAGISNFATVQLRNNTTVRETETISSLGASQVSFPATFAVMGDILTGDGVKTFDLNNLAVGGGPPTVYGTIVGYLE